MVGTGLAASPGGVGVRMGDAVRRAGEVDFGMKEKGSSPAWLKAILPFAPKANLPASFAEERDKIIKTQNDNTHSFILHFLICFHYLVIVQFPEQLRQN